jgi:hypothetical protein
MSDGTAVDASQTSTIVVDRVTTQEWEMERPAVNNVQTGTTATLSYTPPDVANAYLVVCVTAEDVGDNSPITGITYNGVAMTALSEAAATGDGNAMDSVIYGLVAPGTSAADIVVTGGERISVTALTLSGSGAIAVWAANEIANIEASFTLSTGTLLADPVRPTIWIHSAGSGGTTDLVSTAATRALSTTQRSSVNSGTDARQEVLTQDVVAGQASVLEMSGFVFRGALASVGFVCEL